MSSKYAALPDLDESQDIYETPDLASDISTLPTATSPANSDIDDSDLPRPSESHALFAGARSAQDRIAGKRKSYAVYGEHDGEDRESPEQRLARLKREVEELRGEMETESREGEVERGVEELAEVLAKLGTPHGGAEKRLAKKMAETLGVSGVAVKEAPKVEEKTEAQYTVTYSPHYKSTHTLSRIADFDERLSILEKVLGIPADGEALPTHAMIPALNELQRKLSVMNSSSIASLDAAARRVKHLTAEAEKLTEARKAAATAGGDRDPLESLEMVSKVNALYGVLPTIEKMAPLLPGTLDRLRSLRGIHGDAARASEALGEVEERQEEMKAEVEKWEEALGKVEVVMRESRGTIESNVTKVEGWVREIEEKMEKIGGA